MTNLPSPLFLKWAGGKRSILSEIHSRIPEYSGQYIEPFLGGGSVFFSQEISRKKLVSDSNSELINTYITVRDNPDELMSRLSKFQNTPEEFYEVRSWDRETGYDQRDKVDKAARFIFLNKTCYNGLYRVNSKGEFNVPFGKYKNPLILNEESIVAAHKFLSHKTDGMFTSTITCGDYLETVEKAGTGDFVYLDPPYVPLSKTEAFVSYTSEGFGETQQLELRDALLALKRKEIPFLMSNSDTPFIEEHYENHSTNLFNVEREINVRRSLGANSSSRIKVREVLVS